MNVRPLPSSNHIGSLLPRLLCLSLLCLIAWPAQAQDDTQPLKSSAPDGLGPLALPNLNHFMLGSAHVYEGQKPDLFIAGRSRTTPPLYLFKWLRTTEDGVPVFAPPVEIKSPFTSNGTIFQAPDKGIHGLWLNGKELIHTTFDRDKLSFQEAGRLTLEGLPSSPQGVAATVNPDGTVDLIFEMSARGTVKYPDRETNASSVNWRPYDAAGISTAPVHHRYAVQAKLPGLLKGPLSDIRQMSRNKYAVYSSMIQMTPVQLGPDQRGMISGSRMGNLYYFRNVSSETGKPGRRHLIADKDGNALRHPSVAPGVCAFPSSDGYSDIIAGGEGAVYFYKFTGRFTKQGAPIFEDPVPVLQEQADLYAGTLPSPAVVDWDGDGIPDILAGNSEGFVLFFKNIGTVDDPRFLPGERIKAGGRDLHIQAGYSGSVQGTPEARWGYLSATPFDWNEDGLTDLILGDITGNYTICLNRGTKTEPKLDPPHPIYCDGLDLHGMWRCRAAVARLGDRIAMIILDGDDNFHLYWKIDDYNVEDGGKLTMQDGSLISGSFDPAGGTGRLKLDLYDGDKDGVLDLAIGTGRRASIPNRAIGFPMPMLGLRTLGTPLFMRNVGTNEKPAFAMPSPFLHSKAGVIQPGGSHESGAVLTELGGDGPNLLTGNEVGRLFLYRGANMKFNPSGSSSGR